MSSKHTENITCPRCGKKFDFVVWDSINTMINPELKESVRSGELFAAHCPHCSTETIVDYPFLYHQMEDQFMIYYLPYPKGKTSSVDYNKMKVALYDDPVIQDVRIPISYRYRIVNSIFDFYDKLRIMDAKLDDRYVEIYKLLMERLFQDKLPNNKLTNSMFFKDEERYSIGLISGEEIPAYATFNMDSYRKIVEDFNFIVEEENSYMINRSWAKKILDKVGITTVTN